MHCQAECFDLQSLSYIDSFPELTVIVLAVTLPPISEEPPWKPDHCQHLKIYEGHRKGNHCPTRRTEGPVKGTEGLHGERNRGSFGLWPVLNSGLFLKGGDLNPGERYSRDHPG